MDVRERERERERRTEMGGGERLDRHQESSTVKKERGRERTTTDIERDCIDSWRETV